MREMKPCPFCKSESWNRDEKGMVWFFHRKGCFIKTITEGHDYIIMNKKEQADWNRRADSGKGE